MRTPLLPALTFLLGSAVPALAGPPFFETTTVFPVTPKNKPNYRIPALIQVKSGDLLAIVEKRNDGIGDVGNHDIVLKRSRDLGKTWGPEVVVLDDGPNTCTDLTLCLDRERNRLFLFFLKDKKQFAYLSTDDDGASWQGPVVIHREVIKPEWETVGVTSGQADDSQIDPESRGSSKARAWAKNWVQRYGIGPGHGGIQLSTGPHKGRLVVPARHKEEVRPRQFHSFTHLLSSDDHGATWKLGPNIAEYGSEAQLVELADGRILASMRDENGQDDPDKYRQLFALSADGGETWSAPRKQPELINPRVHASIQRYSTAAAGGKNRLLFSNPAHAAREKAHPYGRYNLAMRISYDEGQTWSAPKTIYAPPASYCDVAPLSDGTIGIIYERGPEGGTHYWDELQFARFNLEWLTDGHDSPGKSAP